jgi:threonine/homoserine/homoserine lactone efflux protein
MSAGTAMRVCYSSRMFDTSTLQVFIVTALALLMTPGPAVLYIVTRSIEQGRIAGLVSVLGICTGTLIHVAAAALGLSALLVSSALAFNAVRYLGAVYLIAIGLQTILRPDPVATTRSAAPRATLGEVYRQGVIVNVLNPHTALFFFSFLPQFVDASRGRVGVQILGLGLLFVVLSAGTDSGWAVATGSAGDWIKRQPRFVRVQRYVTGGVLVGLGAAAAWSGRKA